MRKLIVIVVGVVCGLLLLAELGVYRIGDGAFPLAVELVSDDPPNRVSAQVLRDRDEAVWAAEQSHLYDEFRRVVTVDPSIGQPLEVLVECSSRETLLRRQTNWYQAQFLVIHAEWPDGRRAAKVVEIPDGRTTRTLCIELP